LSLLMYHLKMERQTNNVWNVKTPMPPELHISSRS
jgi:hypothetical protein